MFDIVSVAVPLPYSEEMRELGLDKNNREYQTKDLECYMGRYVIQSGRLFEQKYKKTEWVEGDPKSEFLTDKLGRLSKQDPYWEDVNYHGEISFYDYLSDIEDKWNCWVEFKATFTRGVLEGIELVRFTKKSNEEQKKFDLDFLKEQQRIKNLWHNKYFFHTKIIRKFRQKIWYKFWIKVSDITQKIAFL